MSRKALLSVVMVLVAAGLVFTIAFAQSSQKINPFSDGLHVNVTADTSLTISWAWVASSPGLVRMFKHASNHSYLLTDESNAIVISIDPSTAEAYWGPVYVLENPGSMLDNCMGRRISRSNWAYPLGTLPPGDYTLSTTLAITHSLTDGCDWDSDGRPDIMRPRTTISEVYIHVTE